MSGPVSVTKKLYLNGALVGEVEATGDDERDMEIARQFLREKGLYKETTQLQALFRQAVSFATAASCIYNRDLVTTPRNGLSAAPFVVNSALSIELYLKTLARVHGKTLRGHDLLRLLDALPSHALDALTQQLTKSSIGWDVSTFRRSVGEVKDAFVEWRYLHETGTSSGTIVFQSVIAIMKVLHDVCRNSNLDAP